VISSSQRPLPDNTLPLQQTNIHVPDGIRTHNISRRAAVDLRLDGAATGTNNDRHGKAKRSFSPFMRMLVCTVPQWNHAAQRAVLLNNPPHLIQALWPPPSASLYQGVCRKCQPPPPQLDSCSCPSRSPTAFGKWLAICFVVGRSLIPISS